MNVPFLNREVPTLHAAALILGAAALLSKILGLFRDRLLAAHFGAGQSLDTYYAAFQIPDLIYTLFLVGAASAAVLPVLIDSERRGRDEADQFLSNLLTVFTAAAICVTAVAVVVAPWLMRLAAPGFGAADFALAVRLTRLMLAGTIFLGIAGILSSALQSAHRFVAFSLPPVVYNLGIIAGILFAVPFFGVRGLAYGVIAGGLLQVVVQIPTFRAIGFRFRPRFTLADRGLRRVVRTSIPRVMALAMSQVTLTALTAVASFFAAGSISVFKFASNLVYVPVGLFGVSWALAMFPKLSGATLAGRGEEFRSHIAIGVRSILFWVLPVAVLFVVLRAHVVRVVLGSGIFDWEDTRLVAATLAVLASAVISESLLPLILRAFYALGRTREPLFWDVSASVATIGLAVGAAVFFQLRPGFLHGLAVVLRVGDLAPPRILAVAAAFSLGSLLNIVLLGTSLRRAARRHLGVTLSFEGRAIAVMLGAAVLGGVATYLALLPFPAIVATNTFIGIALQGFVAGVVGFAVYGAALATQRNPEMLGLLESFRRRLWDLQKIPQVYETEKLDGEAGR